MLNHEMVVLAREYRNVTQEQLARSLFVSQATIAKIEGGIARDLPEETVQRLATALGFPVSFFHQPDGRLGFGSSAFFYRKKAEITAVDRKRISGVVNLLRIHLKRLLDAVDFEAKRKLPMFDVEEFGGSAEQIAQALRGAWLLPDGPVANLTALMESAGILIVPCDFGTRSMDATSMRLTDMPPLVFINKDLPGDRWRFTLAHELGHLVMHQSHKESMEDEADAFASEFLMPDIELRAQFLRMPKIRLQDLANLKPFWKVSMGALLMKAGSLGFLADTQKRYLWAQMSKMGYRSREPNELPREVPQNHENLITYYRDELKFSISDLAETVHVTPQEFESLHGVLTSSAQGVRHLRLIQ